ncbi:MAG: hypothetical protein WC107_02705 [Patescibacteria group bacterium]
MNLPKMNVNFETEKIKDYFLQINWHSGYFQLMLLIIIVFLLSYIIDFLLSRSIFGKRYRIFVAPGIILHELSHALFCLVTGAKITKVSLFEAEGGSVEHSAPKLPILGQMMISLAPFITGIVAIYFLAHFIGIKPIEFSPTDLSYEKIIHYFVASFSAINVSSYRNWIILYFIISIIVTMTPSIQDFKNLLMSTLVFTLLIILAAQLRLLNFIANLQYAPAISIMSSVVSLLLLACLFSIIIFGITKFIKR